MRNAPSIETQDAVFNVVSNILDEIPRFNVNIVSEFEGAPFVVADRVRDGDWVKVSDLEDIISRIIANNE